MISRPLRSAMSNLYNITQYEARRQGRAGSVLPVQIVVQNLDRRCPRSPGGFLPDRDEDSRIWFPDEKALFSLPFKRMSASKEELSYIDRATQRDSSLTLPS